MEKPLLELSSNLSWNLITKRSLTVTPGIEPTTYNPIPRQTFLCPSNLMLIGIKNPVARSNWWLGARVNVNLLINPDSQSDFPTIALLHNKACPLNIFTLLHWYEYQPKPYMIIMSIPWWHEKIEFEAYWYDGINSSNQEVLLQEINSKLPPL